MYRLIIFLFLITVSYAQTQTRFSNYGPEAPLSEGDANYLQVINLKIPSNYNGDLFFQLFDADCGGTYDMPMGSYNSKFRFSLYKGELREDYFVLREEAKSELSASLLKSEGIGLDEKYDNKWTMFRKISVSESDERIYSLLVESLEGNDANVFELKVTSDSLGNNMIDSKLYSYEPTIRMNVTAGKNSFRIFSPSGNEKISLNTFDSDRTKIYFSTILRNEIPNYENNPTGWSSVKYLLNEYERDNYCSIDFGPESKKGNIVTFYVLDMNGEKLPINLPAFEKTTNKIPQIVSTVSYEDCNDFTIDASRSKAKGSGQLKHSILFSDGKKVLRDKLSHYVTIPGNYWADIYVEEEGTEITRASLKRIIIKINERPIAKIVGKDIGAPNELLTFDASSSKDKDGVIKKYFWDFGDGTTSTSIKRNHAFAKPGKYKVTLRIEDDFDSACNSSYDSLFITINSQPIINTNKLIVGAVDELLTFDAKQSVDSDGEIVKYKWDFGNFGTAQTPITQTSFPKSGTYNCKLTVVDNSSARNNTVTENIVVKINNRPVAIAGKDVTLAVSENYTFDGSKSSDADGKLINYLWKFSDGFSSSEIRTTHKFSVPGKYKAVLQVKDNSNTISESDEDSIAVIVNQAPVAIIENEKYAKDGKVSFSGEKSFDNDGRITKYFWEFGDGEKSETASPTHLYKIAGTYKVILKVIDNTSVSNNYSFDTSYVTINKRPIADAGPDYTISENSKLVFKSSNSVDQDGKIVNTRWFINNQIVGSESELEYYFEKAGTYEVGLEVEDDFVYPLKGYDKAIVKVNSAPEINITAPKNSEPNKKVVFDASQSNDKDGVIIKYEWKFSDGETSNKKVVEKTFAKSGIYTAELTVYDDSKVANSISKESVVIKINSQPIIKIDDEIINCQSTISFDASQSYDPDGEELKYTWDFPDKKNISASGKINYTFAQRGILPVTVTVDDGNGFSNSVSKKTVMVKLHYPPVADAGADTTVCVGDVVIINGQKSKSFNKGLLKYEWTFDDSSKQSGSSVYKVYKKGGIYNVSLKVFDDSGLDCNTDIDTKVITVIDAPLANAGNDIEACANAPVHFDGSKSKDIDGIVNAYEWDFGDGDTGGGVTPIHIYDKPGIYKVTLTITGDVIGECDNTSKDELTVTVTDAPLAVITSRDSIPANLISTFDASQSKTNFGNIASYEWSFSDGFKSNQKSVEHSFAKAGLYTINLKIKTDLNNACNTALASKQIYVNETPIAKANVISKAAIGEVVSFDASQSIDENGQVAKYLWSYGDGSKGEGILTQHTYEKSGVYNVELKVFDETNLENNWNAKSFQITINEPPVAKFFSTEFTYQNATLSFDANQSSDKDGEIKNYKWFINDEIKSESKSFNYEFSIPGIYNIRLLVEDDSGMKNKIGELTKTILIRDYPEIIVPKEITICENYEYELQPQSYQKYQDAKLNYYLESDGNYVQFAKSAKVSYATSGKRIIKIGISDFAKNKLTEAETIVNVVPPIKIKTIADTTVYIGKANDETLFNASKYIDQNLQNIKVKWNFGDGSFSDDLIVLHSFKKEGVYKASLEVDNLLGLPCSTAKQSFIITVKKQ